MSQFGPIKMAVFVGRTKATLKLIMKRSAESNQAVMHAALRGPNRMASDEHSETFTASKALIAHKALFYR